MKCYDDESLCQQFIRTKSKQSIFLIVSGRLSREIVPAIHSLDHVLAIYIYCMDTSRHLKWAEGFVKVNFRNFNLTFFLSILDQRCYRGFR